MYSSSLYVHAVDGAPPDGLLVPDVHWRDICLVLVKRQHDKGSCGLRRHRGNGQNQYSGRYLGTERLKIGQRRPRLHAGAKLPAPVHPRRCILLHTLGTEISNCAKAPGAQLHDAYHHWNFTFAGNNFCNSIKKLHCNKQKIKLYLQVSFLHHSPVFATLLPLAVCKFVLWYNGVSMLRTLYKGYCHTRNFISNFGLSALAETEWSRLNVPCVLRTFWMLRVSEQVVQILSNHYKADTFSLYTMISSVLANGCETLTALLGMTSIVSSICHYIGYFFQWVLMTEESDEKSMGTVSAILFYILALQSGLTSLDRDKRVIRLYRNFCLLFTAVLHFVHNFVNPLLMSLSASHNPALHRHIRALVVCAFLIIFPVALLIYLWSRYTISTWILAVSVFSIEVIVKVLVSLAIYSLFLFDAYRSSFWEQLDDCVYMIRFVLFHYYFQSITKSYDI